jgi:hypothetical protein
MRRWFADSFFLIAALSKRDRFHRSCLTILRELRTEIIATDWILLEVADAMASRSSRGQCLALLDFLRTHPHVTIIQASHEHFQKGLDLYASRPDKDWPLTDCISFVIMQEQGISEALTGDRHFMQAGFRALLSEIRQ